MDPVLTACVVIYIVSFVVLAIIKILQTRPVVIDNRRKSTPSYNQVDPHVTKIYRKVVDEIPTTVHRTTIISNPPPPRRTTVVRRKTTRYIPDFSPPVPKKRVVKQTATTKRRVEEPPQTVSPQSPKPTKTKSWWESDSGDNSWSSRKKKSTSFAKTKRR